MSKLLAASSSETLWGSPPSIDTLISRAAAGSIFVEHPMPIGCDDYGVDLLRKAFRPVNRPERPMVEPGPLTDKTLPVAEQEGMRDLFVGAIALFKNPPSTSNREA